MLACITGASSGLGRDMARALARRGWSLILIARRVGRLEALARELAVPVRILPADLSTEEGCLGCLEQLSGEPIDLFINNAGFGLCGSFDEIPLERELEMIDLNVQAVHILSKWFLADARTRGRGYLLNVASVAGFLPGGPLFATYYATKSYVLSLSHALHAELRRAANDHLSVSVLCPGPVATEFDTVAGLPSHLRGANSAAVAEYAIAQTLRRKFMILPNFSAKALYLARRCLPVGWLLTATMRAQKKKLTGK